MLLAERDPPLGIAHFTVIDVPPPELVELAARIGYACIGLRLHPAFPGAPFYEIPSGSAAMREMKQRLGDTGIAVYDIEFVTVGEGFVAADLAAMLASAAELGAKRLSVCGDDPDPARQVASFAALCDLAAGFGMGVDLECMAWRQVASFPDAVRVVEAAGRPNGGALVDAIHLSRTGGSPADLAGVPPQLDPQRPALRRPGPAPGDERGDHPGGPLRPAAAGPGRAALARAAGGTAAGCRHRRRGADGRQRPGRAARAADLRRDPAAVRRLPAP